ncbi:hypothetical protein FisN_18Lh195 [Fistulifera solaris]|uniref:GAF domain-containing protein n=1 Tax=Fistulifera solaris TaxID=1519565 RepID=A0A1Z5JU30_FISSO|nr:hypothetical protein FisN_18Lh195 [Fistulifera solaris]|eukprot:GAX17545.1 hypothetical protein FisN_18Lh195 [Fistulifera solaris]
MGVPKTKYPSVLDFDSTEELTEAIQKMDLSSIQKAVESKERSQPSWRLQCPDIRNSLPQSIESEAARLENLRSFQILETDNESIFDSLTEKVRKHFDASWAHVSFIDLGRQWYKSTASAPGREILFKEVARDHAFCAHTILNLDPVFEVFDTLEDNRFRENPLVTAFPKVRWYAGVPLVSPEGHRLGAFFVADIKARPEGLSDGDKEYLMQKAQETMQYLIERRDSKVSKIPITSCTNMKKRSSNSDLVSLKAEKSRSPSPPALRNSGQVSISSRSLPDPSVANVHPDAFLAELIEAMFCQKLQVKPCLELQDFFPVTTEDQMKAYTVEVTTIARSNDVVKLRDFFQQQGKAALDCYNRFGEGLLNLACRRGFRDMAQFLMNEVELSVRVRDDYGRTPLHDACWNPEPQLEICSWIIARDPSLFLIADKRGFTPFQYARPGDWIIWRRFLFDHRHHLSALMQPDILQQFA